MPQSSETRTAERPATEYRFVVAAAIPGCMLPVACASAGVQQFGANNCLAMPHGTGTWLVMTETEISALPINQEGEHP